MDFSLSSEHQTTQKMARDFVQKEIAHVTFEPMFGTNTDIVRQANSTSGNRSWTFNLFTQR